MPHGELVGVHRMQFSEQRGETLEPIEARVLFGQLLSEMQRIKSEGDFEAARNLAQGIAHHEVEGESELMLGQLAWLSGDLELAAVRFGASLAICRAAEDMRGEADALHWLGRADLDAGRLDAARQRLGGALRSFQSFEMFKETVDSIEGHVALMAACGEASRAVELAAAATQARARLALPRLSRLDHQWQQLLQGLHTALGTEHYDNAWRRGRRMETADAVQAVLAAAG